MCVCWCVVLCFFIKWNDFLKSELLNHGERVNLECIENILLMIWCMGGVFKILYPDLASAAPFTWQLENR